MKNIEITLRLGIPDELDPDHVNEMIYDSIDKSIPDELLAAGALKLGPMQDVIVYNDPTSFGKTTYSR